MDSPQGEPTLPAMATPTLDLDRDPITLDTGDAQISVRTVGRGPDVVLVHGWPLHGATWRNIVPVIAQRFTCHVIDLPGCGKSELSRGKATLRAHAVTVERAIERLGLERVAFIAHDSGGAVARLAAASLGRRTWGLVLGNTEISAYRPPMLQALIGLAKIPGGLRLLPLVLRSGFLRRSPLGFGGCFDDTSLADGEFGDLFVRPMLQSKRAAIGQLALVHDFDWSVIDTLAEVHARIVAPTLLLWGDRDPWFPIERARRMTSEFRGGAELRELPGKLFVHEELPHAWAKLALDFLMAQRAVQADRIVTAARGALD
jgi:haloalkane dehalogenase